MIRSTKHYLQDCNSGKKEIISSFLKEYRFAVQSYIDYIWSNELSDANGNIIWSINDDKLFLPKFLDYKIISHGQLPPAQGWWLVTNSFKSLHSAN